MVFVDQSKATKILPVKNLHNVCMQHGNRVATIEILP